MAAGWLYAQEKGYSAPEALRFAVAAGAAALLSEWLPGRAAIENMLTQTGAPQAV